MSREIKFRGKRLDNGEWVFGNPVEWLNETKDISIVCHPFGCCIDSKGNLVLIEAPFVCKVDPATVGQYTGLKDGKRTEEYPEGQEIYEGDIIKAVALANDHNQRGAITISAVEYWMGNACLKITYIPLYPFIVDHSFEVIGNIHDDLLKEVTP